MLDCVLIGTLTICGVCWLTGNLTVMTGQPAQSFLFLFFLLSDKTSLAVFICLHAKLTIYGFSYIFNIQILQWYQCSHLTLTGKKEKKFTQNVTLFLSRLGKKTTLGTYSGEMADWNQLTPCLRMSF